MNSDTYWLADPDVERVAAECRRRIDAYAERMDSLGRSDIWRRMSALRFSRDSDSNVAATDVKIGGQRGELIGTRMNMLSRYVRAVGVMVTGSRPSYQARSIASSALAISQVAVGDALCDFAISKRDAEEVAKRAFDYMLLYGEGWTAPAWDERAGKMLGQDEQGRQRYEGDIVITAKRPDEVVRDVDLDESATHEWLLVARQVSRWKLMQQHPELADYIKTANTRTRLEDIRDSLTVRTNTERRQRIGDVVTVYELFAPPSVMLPEGRYAMLLGDRLIADDRAIYDDLAHYPMIADYEPGTCWGHSFLWDQCGPQQVIDALFNSSLSIIHNYAKPTMFIPEGSVLDVSKEASVLPFRVVRGTVPPTMIAMDPSVLAPLFEAFDRVVDAMTQMTGLNDAALGDAGKSQSGQALATMHTMAQQSVSGAQAAYSTGFGEMMFGVIKRFRAFATSERIIQISGSSYTGDVAKFKASDLLSIEGIDTEMGPASLRHSTGKKEFADKMLERGAITMEQYREVMATGKAEPIVDRPRSQRRLVEEENERMRDGKPVAVNLTDDHRAHIQGHACVGDDSELRIGPTDEQGNTIMEQGPPDPMTGMPTMVPAVNPILAARDAHIQEHIEALKNMDPDLASALEAEPVPGQVMAQQMGLQQQQAAQQAPAEGPTALPGGMPVSGVPDNGANNAPVADPGMEIA